MNYIQYMKPGDFNSSQWDFNAVDKSKLTPEQIKYAVELYFWRTKDPEMKKQYELWSDYQKRINASLNADPISNIAAAAELPEVTITMAKPNYIDLIKSGIRNKWTNMSTEDKVHAGIDAATTIGGFIPGVDVVADGADVLHSLQRKDWAGAGIGAAATVLPFVSAPMLRKIKTLSNTLFSPEVRSARAMNKNIRLTVLQPTAADEAVLRGQLGWAPKQTIPYRHGSLDPELKTFVPKHDRWDVVTHGADPYMYFVTDLSTPVSAANMMDLRPYQYTGSIVAEKPMVQVGDFNIAGKNATRNQLISRARQQGADTYLLQDIVDNKVPHLNIVARFIGPEGEAVQGGAASIKWYGPTMGKTTAAKTNPNLVDIDPLLKPIRAKHAERLGLKISDPKVSADPAYKQEVADFVLEWRANPENQGKTLVASTKHLLYPQYKINFANDPSIPAFETFAARNKARGFKETDEQLRAWYNSIFELGRELGIDNRFVSDIEGVTLAHPAISTSTQSTTPDHFATSKLLALEAPQGHFITNYSAAATNPPSKTSLAFFERLPAKISEAERLGISKGDRGNLSRFQKEALEDLTTYRNKWIRQKYPLLDSNGNIIWSNGTNKSFLDTYVAPLRGDQYKGVLLYPHIEDDGSYLMRMSMGSDDLNGGFAGYNGISEITLTSPKMNAINLEIPIPIEQASPTLPKEGVKTFWAALQDVALPGSYISGDFGGRPLGYNLIRQYNKIGTPIVSTTNTGVRAIIGRNGYLNVINELFRKIPWKSHYDGLSTDSYMALLKLGNRPGYKLRFSKDGFTNWNHQSFENKYILDLYEQALIDPTKLQEFLKVFHDWVAPYGGHDAVIKNGKIIIPLPFIVRQKSGGTIHIKKKNRGKFTDYCGGKVTEECIRKGKNSSNPTTRKRANFAWVARHKFKHEEGGKINYLNIF